MKIILASQSPRRRELLGQIGLEFDVKVSDVEEIITTNIPYELVENLSLQKANAVYEELLKHETANSKNAGTAHSDNHVKDENEQDILIIGADTVVSIDDKILGKPANEMEAIEMLRALSGRTHQVYTGVTMLYCPLNKEFNDSKGKSFTSGDILRIPDKTWSKVAVKSFHEKTEVTFYTMSEEEIAGYVATGDCFDKADNRIWYTPSEAPAWADKAGAYGIQDPFGMKFVKEIRGDFYNVVGLPVSRLYQELKKLGVI